MANGTTQQAELTPQQRFQEAAIKEKEKIIQEQTRAEFDGLQQQEQFAQQKQGIIQGLLSQFASGQQGQQGSTTQDVATQLLDLASQQVPTSQKKGVLSSLLKGVKPSERGFETQNLGVNTAAKILRLQQQETQAQQKVPKQQLDVIKTLQDILSSTPAGRRQLEINKAEGQALAQEAKETAKEQRGVKGQLTAIKGFVRSFEDSELELVEKIGPEALQTGIGGQLTRLIAQGSQQLGNLPKTAAFTKNIKVRANKMARTIEGGRVTDQDRKVYADALANAVGAPSEENVSLLGESLLNLNDLGGDIAPQVNEFRSSKSKTLRDTVTFIEERLGQSFASVSPEATKQGKSFSNLSDEDIDARIAELEGRR